MKAFPCIKKWDIKSGKTQNKGDGFDFSAPKKLFLKNEGFPLCKKVGYKKWKKRKTRAMGLIFWHEKFAF
jgi:hypothetical protein